MANKLFRILLMIAVMTLGACDVPQGGNGNDTTAGTCSAHWGEQNWNEFNWC
jgi:hypothetical protein